MKEFILSTLLLIASIATVRAQEAQLIQLVKDEVTNDYYYEEVVNATDLTQAELYARAKAWVLANFKTIDNNINFDAKEFTIVNSTAVKLDKEKALSEGYIEFKFHFAAKDGKYKVRIDYIIIKMDFPPMSGLTPQTDSYGQLGKKKYDRIAKKQTDEKLTAISQTFKKGMATGKSDW